MKLPFVSRKKYDAVVYKLECLLCHATGGRYSKSSYSLADMCKMVTDYIDCRVEDRDSYDYDHNYCAEFYKTSTRYLTLRSNNDGSKTNDS